MTVLSRRVADILKGYWARFDDELSACEALASRDPAALRRRLERAWDRRDARVLAAGAEALDRVGALDVEFCVRAGASLYPHRRPEHQLRFLHHALVKDVGQPGVLFHRARAEAAAGRWDEARASICAVLAQRPDNAAGLELLAQLDEIARLQAVARRSPDWADWRLLADALVNVRAWAEAGVLARASRKLPVPAKANRLQDLRRVLDVGLDAGMKLKIAQGVLAAALERYPDDPELRALRLDCAALAGRAEETLADELAGPPADDDYRGAWAASLADARQTVGDSRGAAQAFGELTERFPRDLDLRMSLAFSIGQAAAPPPAKPAVRTRPDRRIISVFPFNDELSLLDIRLHEMADWVDHFVLVEACQTFVGNPKPLHYLENRQLYADFADRITHVRLEEFPPHARNNWAREFHQRDVAAAVLAELCAPEDLVLITDVDEIVDRRALEGFDGDFARLQMPLYRYFLNYRPMRTNPAWSGRTGAVWTWRALRPVGLSYARFHLSRLEKDWARIENAGWHFSSLGNAETVTRKFANYSHQEHKAAALKMRDMSLVSALLADLKSGKFQKGWERSEVDETLPAYIREHQDELADLIL